MSLNRYSNIHLNTPNGLPLGNFNVAGVQRTRQTQQLSSTSVKSVGGQQQQLRSSQNQIRHEKSQSQQIPPSSQGGAAGGTKLPSAGGINFNNQQSLNN